MRPDTIDTASELEELQRQAAIQAHRINRNAVSAEHCEDCGDPIPDARRIAVPGCQTCVSCAIDVELRLKIRGK